MLGVLIESVCGWLIYSLGAYWLHRGWHWSLMHNKHLPGASGEREHHIAFDKPRVLPPSQVNFGPAGGLVALFIVGIGMLVSPTFAFAALLCFVIDEQVHRTAHQYPPKDILDRIHAIHHRKHHCNYAFATGIVWDWLFGTLETGK